MILHFTATPHRPSPFIPTSSAFGGLGPQFGGVAGQASGGPGSNPAAAAAAAAAAADYASWLCRPLGMPNAAAAAAAGAGYLPLQANILAARLNISK